MSSTASNSSSDDVNNASPRVQGLLRFHLLWPDRLLSFINERHNMNSAMSHNNVTETPKSSTLTVTEALQMFVTTSSSREEQSVTEQGSRSVFSVEETAAMIKEHFDAMLPVKLLYPTEFQMVSGRIGSDLSSY